MTIEIRILADSADIAHDEMLRLLGFRSVSRETADRAERFIEKAAAEAAGETGPSDAHMNEPTGPAEPEPTAPAAAPAEKKTRSRKAKDAPAASVSSTDNGGQTDIEDAIAATPAISTGEERVGPEDDAATVAQDEADEKAESDAARDPEKPLTLDDVRAALGEYVRVYGMAAAQEDGPKVITLVCGEGKVKVSDIADDKIAAVVSGVVEMMSKNPFKREKVAA